MPKHTLTPEWEDTLQQFADRLPVPEQAGRTPMLGAQLLKEQPGITGPKGEPIEAGKMYYIGTPTNAVNHLRRLRKAFQEGGQAAVVRYLQPFEAFLGQE